MKRRFIRRFIITLENCIDALALHTRDAYSTGFLGDNKSPYKPPFHRITYIYILQIMFYVVLTTTISLLTSSLKTDSQPHYGVLTIVINSY